MPTRALNPNAPSESDAGWTHFVEPYFGSGAVLFAQDPEGISEVANDINGELTNFWDVLKNAKSFRELVTALTMTPCSAVEFKRSKNGDHGADDVSRAVAFLVRNRQSRQALGKDFATIARNRTRSGMNELPSAWLSAIDGLPEIHRRLQRVVILNQDALKCIKQQDGKRTLYYLDPTYISTTRHGGGGEYGTFEMSIEAHEKLLSLLATIDGRFLLSGYDHELYRSHAKKNGWRCESFLIDNKASSKRTKDKKLECIWMNY